MVSAQYLRGARRGGGNLLAGRPKILGEGGNENLYPPLSQYILKVPARSYSVGNTNCYTPRSQRALEITWRAFVAVAGPPDHDYGRSQNFIFDHFSWASLTSEHVQGVFAFGLFISESFRALRHQEPTESTSMTPVMVLSNSFPHMSQCTTKVLVRS